MEACSCGDACQGDADIGWLWFIISQACTIYGSVCVGYGGVEWYKGGKMGKSEKGGDEREGEEKEKMTRVSRFITQYYSHLQPRDALLVHVRAPLLLVVHSVRRRSA